VQGSVNGDRLFRAVNIVLASVALLELTSGIKCGNIQNDNKKWDVYVFMH